MLQTEDGQPSQTDQLLLWLFPPEGNGHHRHGEPGGVSAGHAGLPLHNAGLRGPRAQDQGLPGRGSAWVERGRGHRLQLAGHE